MDVQQMRLRLKKEYSSEQWQKKVDKMSDSQVIAIFKRLTNKGQIKI